MKYLIWSWLSRAILKNAPILVLDEATAFADPENEYEMQLALAELVKGKTVIVIAHRLKTIRHADQIYVLDQGRVVEAGKHDELIARHGLCEAVAIAAANKRLAHFLVTRCDEKPRLADAPSGVFSSGQADRR